MVEKESSQEPSSISPEIAAISYMDAETLVFSDMVSKIAAVSSINTDGREFYQIQMTEI